MLIPFGVLSAAAFAPVAEGDYELIASEILTASQASVTFSNLGDYSSTYKHLQIRYAARNTGDFAQLRLQFNADSGSNYAWHNLTGNGSSVGVNAATTQTFANIGRVAQSTFAANIFGGGVIDILEPYSTTKNKTLRGLGGSANNLILLQSSLWINTASVTSFLLEGSGGSFTAGSRFSLYGIRG
jgi:hypothetical protein